MDTKTLQKIIFETVQFDYDKEIELSDYDGIYVSYDGENAKIGYTNISQLTRGYFLFAKNFNKGCFEIKEKPHFDNCGCMIDASRNGVITVPAVKKFINYMAALGLNILMLYTEDTYEIKDYPKFGYMRGRYSGDEIREIDLYAKEMGIELVPCIQTLGHLEQYLKHDETKNIRDTKSVLLVDCPETYDFIEAEIKAVKEYFSTDRIHIGMDEAYDIGTGKYLADNGYCEKYKLLTRHLKKVVDICKKYELKPMMWNDMFFTEATPNRYYYNYKEANFSSEMLEDIPDIDTVYWDYYSNDEQRYTGMIKKSAELGKRVVFAGCITIWHGFLPNHKATVENTIPALKMCIKNGVGDIFATMWGDDGTETNVFLAIPYLSLYSEYFYKGSQCSMEDIIEASEFLSKTPWEVTKAMGSFQDGKRYVYADIMYYAGNDLEEYNNKYDAFTKSADIIKEYLDKSNGDEVWVEYAKLLYDIAISKLNIFKNFRKAYEEKDKEYLKELANNVLPDLKEKMIELKKVHKTQWHSVYKTFGFETLSARYGGIISRIDDCIEILNDYLNGTIDEIEILEEEYLSCPYFYGATQLMIPGIA